MGKTIHPLFDLDVNPSIGSDNNTKVVVDDDFVGDYVEMEIYVFGVWHGGVKVEIGKANAQKICPQGADGGMDEEFGHGEISHGCTLVARIANMIAADSESNMTFFAFLGPISRMGVCEMGCEIWG